jgi:hypothetical protein
MSAKNTPAQSWIGDDPVGEKLLDSAVGELTPVELDALWELFQQIGREWQNVWNDSAGQRSSWLEFVQTRCRQRPSYLEEYRSAVKVIDALVREHGMVEGYRRLLLDKSIPERLKARPAKTRLEHAKVFVVNEFIRVQIAAGGFRGFGGKKRAYNYNGFVRGSRYNRVKRVRAVHRKEEERLPSPPGERLRRRK